MNKPTKTGRCNCTRCGGSGVVHPWGQCFRCGGCGADPTYRDWVYPAGWTDEQKQAHVESLAAKAEKRHAKKAAAAKAVYAGNVALCPALERFASDEFASQFDGIVLDIVSKSHRFALSDRQLACVTKAVESKDAFLARRAAQRAEAIANAKPVPAGRVEVEGTILSIKEYEGDYGVAIKCLLQCDGYKLFGTVPAGIVADANVGDTVRLTATVKEKEPGFGTYSRPTGGEILAPANA